MSSVAMTEVGAGASHDDDSVGISGGEQSVHIDVGFGESDNVGDDKISIGVLKLVAELDVV